MAEMFGKVTGCSRGRGGSMHLFDAEHRFFGGNAIVGGGLPLAVGLALADQMRGRSRVTACFFGDGAVAEGEFHESLNLAALWRLPVLFCCENNRYAMGTALAKEHAGTDLALRASSYGVAAWPVDGMDVLAVEAAARRAVEDIRGGRARTSWSCGPTGSARTRCTTPTATATRQEIERLEGARPDRRTRAADAARRPARRRRARR